MSGRAHFLVLLNEKSIRTAREIILQPFVNEMEPRKK